MSTLAGDVERLGAAGTTVCSIPFVFAAHGALTARLNALTLAYAYEQQPETHDGVYTFALLRIDTLASVDVNYASKDVNRQFRRARGRAREKIVFTRDAP